MITNERYDLNGNQIYCKNKKSEWWKEFNSNNICVYFRCKSSDFEDIIKCDDNGRVIYIEEIKDGLKTQITFDDVTHVHVIDSNGSEWWEDYDHRSNKVHYKKHNIIEWWKEYDDYGRVIHYKDTIGDEWLKEYNDCGQVIHYKDKDTEWYKNYDDYGNLLYHKIIS